MRLIIFGPPGSGKGTYASRLAPKLGISHIASGDLLREFVKTDSPLATEIKGYMQKGALVPDHLVIDFLKKELEKPEAQKGFILDGFPRTVDQAKALDEVTTIDAVLNINTEREVMMEKITSRRTCRECGEIYNLADIDKEINGVRYVLPPMLPKEEGKCDKCSGQLIQRDDALPDVVKDRLDIYDKASAPVLEYYKGRVPFIEIHANEGPDIVTEKVYQDIQAAGLG